jgi:hypothetical protein
MQRILIRAVSAAAFALVASAAIAKPAGNPTGPTGYVTASDNGFATLVSFDAATGATKGATALKAAGGAHYLFGALGDIAVGTNNKAYATVKAGTMAEMATFDMATGQAIATVALTNAAGVQHMFTDLGAMAIGANGFGYSTRRTAAGWTNLETFNLTTGKTVTSHGMFDMSGDFLAFNSLGALAMGAPGAFITRRNAAGQAELLTLTSGQVSKVVPLTSMSGVAYHFGDLGDMAIGSDGRGYATLIGPVGVSQLIRFDLSSGMTLDVRDLKAAGGMGYQFREIGAVDFTPKYNVTSAGITSAVPEPATWAMMIMGFGAVGLAARRRARVVAA